ncbi:MAG: hypothetical protein JWN73_3217 [Betaproteobacteria bacterium]|nr:hypothetical protein [Betaproteobacteria bacterium]
MTETSDAYPLIDAALAMIVGRVDTQVDELSAGDFAWGKRAK